MEFFDGSFGGFSDGYNLGFRGLMLRNGLSSSSTTIPSSLVLDNDERGELVRAMGKPGQKAASADKALMALRNHSEAERLRRERINGHLSTLRSLIPGTSKMDKAALLAEVVSKVKELKRGVAEATKGTLVPTDSDEVRVEEEENSNNTDSISIRATFCCDFTHELLSDLREALEALPSKTVRAEIATLGSRMVNIFMITGCSEVTKVNDKEGCSVLVTSVREALKSVLDKFYASEEFSSKNTMSNKRRRVSFSGPSGSSSFGAIW